MVFCLNWQKKAYFFLLGALPEISNFSCVLPCGNFCNHLGPWSTYWKGINILSVNKFIPHLAASEYFCVYDVWCPYSYEVRDTPQIYLQHFRGYQNKLWSLGFHLRPSTRFSDIFTIWFQPLEIVHFFLNTLYIAWSWHALESAHYFHKQRKMLGNSRISIFFIKGLF